VHSVIPAVSRHKNKTKKKLFEDKSEKRNIKIMKEVLQDTKRVKKRKEQYTERRGTGKQNIKKQKGHNKRRIRGRIKKMQSHGKM
jgi:hypothetical protein